jgi:hypothetical protein
VEALLDLDWHRQAKQLRESWQGRVLAAAKGHTGAVVLSVLAHNFDGAILTLCQVVFPGFSSIQAPFLCSAGRVDKAGRVIADVAEKDGRISKGQVMYLSDIAYRDDMRRLADRLKLPDQDRLEFFTCVKLWLVADLRLDPTMDPADPDAKRLVYH